jgi:DNA-binding LacI/PurR family transcriptional regulator
VIKSKPQIIRKAVRQREVYELVIDFLKSGRWLPGEKLPVRLELIKELDVSSVTIQRALDDLVADGFLRSDGCRGTFVADYPPYLYTYGVVFNGVYRGTERAGRAEAIRLSMNQLKKRHPDISFKEYHNLEWFRDRTDYNRLIEDIEHRRLAGLIFMNTPFEFNGTPIVESNLPKFAFMSSPQNKEVTTIAMNWSSAEFYSKAIRYFEEKKCKKLAVLVTSIYDQDVVKRMTSNLMAYINGKSLEFNGNMILGGSLNNEVLTLNTLELLFAQPDPPDALLIMDDNITNNISGSFMKLKNRPEKLTILSSTNFPYIPDFPLPIGYIGMDLSETMEFALDFIYKQNTIKGFKSKILPEYNFGIKLINK